MKYSRSDFFKTLYQFCDKGQVEFRYLGKAVKSEFVALEDLSEYTVLRESEVFYSVATRNGGGTKDRYALVPAIWNDVDS